MTLQEYINQKDPKKLPSFSVKVKPEECVSISPVPEGQVVCIKMFTKFFTYLVPKDAMGFYLMDEDGNKRTGSVFSF